MPQVWWSQAAVTGRACLAFRVFLNRPEAGHIMYSSLTLELATAVMAARTADATTTSYSRPFGVLGIRRHRRRAQQVAQRVRLQQLAAQ